jgi:hypothetical protein
MPNLLGSSTHFGLTMQLIYNELGSISTEKSSPNDPTLPDSPPQALGSNPSRLG